MQFFFDFSGAPDIVQDVNHRFRGGFHDVRRQANAVEAAAVVVCHDVHLAQRILALTLGVQVIFDQLNLIAGDAVNRLVDGG